MGAHAHSPVSQPSPPAIHAVASEARSFDGDSKPKAFLSKAVVLCLFIALARAVARQILQCLRLQTAAVMIAMTGRPIS